MDSNFTQVEYQSFSAIVKVYDDNGSLLLEMPSRFYDNFTQVEYQCGLFRDARFPGSFSGRAARIVIDTALY